MKNGGIEVQTGSKKVQNGGIKLQPESTSICIEVQNGFLLFSMYIMKVQNETLPI